MTKQKASKRQIMARVIAIVVAVVMTLSIVFAFVLK